MLFLVHSISLHFHRPQFPPLLRSPARPLQPPRHINLNRPIKRSSWTQFSLNPRSLRPNNLQSASPTFPHLQDAVLSRCGGPSVCDGGLPPCSWHLSAGYSDSHHHQDPESNASPTTLVFPASNTRSQFSFLWPFCAWQIFLTISTLFTLPQYWN